MWLFHSFFMIQLPTEIWSIILNIPRKERFKTIKQSLRFPYKPQEIYVDEYNRYFVHRIVPTFHLNFNNYNPVLFTIIVGYSKPNTMLSQHYCHFVIVRSRFAPPSRMLTLFTEFNHQILDLNRTVINITVPEIARPFLGTYF